MKSYSLLLIFVVLLGLPLYSQTTSLNALLNRAEVLAYQNPDEAITMIENLQKKILSSDSENRINVLLILGNAYSSKQNYQRAIDYGLEALQIANRTQNNVNSIKALGFISNQYYILQMDDKLSEYLDRSEDAITAHPVPDSLNYIVANIYFLRALNYKDQLDSKFSILYFNRSIDAYKKANYKNSKINLPIIYIQKGYSFYDLKMMDSASVCFQKAYSISKANGIASNVAYSQVGLAKVEYNKKNFVQALSYLKSAKQELNTSENLSLQTEIYKGFTENYLALKDDENYKESAERYHQILNENEKYDVAGMVNILKTQHENNAQHILETKKKYSLIAICIVLFLLMTGWFLNRILSK